MKFQFRFFSRKRALFSRLGDEFFDGHKIEHDPPLDLCRCDGRVEMRMSAEPQLVIGRRVSSGRRPGTK